MEMEEKKNVKLFLIVISIEVEAIVGVIYFGWGHPRDQGSTAPMESPIAT